MYFTNPVIPNHWDSDYQGHTEPTFVWELKRRVKENPDAYIKENVEMILKRAEKGGGINMRRMRGLENIRGFTSTTDVFALNTIDIEKVYAVIPIKDNEDSMDRYYIEMVGGVIIRFARNFHDKDIVPYSIPTLDPSEDYWWGNTQSEFSQQYENISNLLMNASASSILM